MLWGSAVAPPSFRPPEGGGPHGSSGVVVLSPRRWPAGGSGGNYKSRHASRRRASRRFPVADAREQVVVFMRRHWRLEPGRRHGDSRRGRAEEALPLGRFPGAQVRRTGRPRTAARAFGGSAGRLSSGGPHALGRPRGEGATRRA